MTDNPRPYSPAPVISHSQCYKTGYAEGAQSEREKVLDEVEKKLDAEPFYHKLRWKYKEIIESLRAGKEE